MSELGLVTNELNSSYQFENILKQCYGILQKSTIEISRSTPISV